MNTERFILVVDDDADFREIVQAKLNACGFKTDSACDGIEAVEKAKKNQPSLIVMDIEMPREDGVSATIDLAKDPLTMNIPVVFLTNLSNEAINEIRRKFVDMPGPKAYFRKQDNYDVLMRSIGALVAA